MAQTTQRATSPTSAAAFWKDYVQDMEITQFPRLREHGFAKDVGDQREFLHRDMMSSTVKALALFSAETEITLDTICATIWATILSRYGTTDVVGFAMIDSFSQSRIYTAQFDNLPSFRSLARSVQHDTDEAQSHATLSLAEIRQLLLESQKPIFNSIVSCSPLDDTVRAEFDIALYVRKLPQELRLELDFNHSHLSRNQAESVLSAVQKAFEAFVQKSDHPINEVDMLGDHDIDRIYNWNKEWPDFVSRRVQDIFEERVMIQPDLPALICDEQIVSYRRLDDLSTRLAHRLNALNVKSDVIVPICFEKSPWAIVSMFGVIKAGGAVVFLDPAHPPARLQEIVKQSKAQVILASHDASPTTDCRPDSILYTVFTSGSTGVPKGCVIEHRQFLSGALQHAARSFLNSESRILQLASYTFDVSILEIVTSLISGACIFIPTQALMAMGIPGAMKHLEITWTFLTPSVVKLLKPEDVPSLKTLILGGEPLSKIDIETWSTRLQLINGYGPSETSIAAAANDNITETTDPANIGRAVGGLCWIVDPVDHNRLTPTGVIGELIIGGPIVARGYLNDPDRTAEVFIEDAPWMRGHGHNKSKRFYKTGDLARFNEDGTIHFIGRKDTQVKLRGLRVELGEVEHHLSVDKRTNHSIVILPKSGPCQKKLVAVLSLHDHSGTNDLKVLDIRNNEELQRQVDKTKEDLGKAVPAYMVPTIWVVVEKLSLLHSGKIDRKGISVWVAGMDQETYSRTIGLQEPDAGEEDMTNMEQQFRRMFCSLLSLSPNQIGKNQSFLGAGGDSVLAMQLMAMARDKGIQITVREILASETLAVLAASARELSQAEIEQGKSGLATLLDRIRVQTHLEQDSIADIYPCSNVQQGMLLGEVKVPGSYQYSTCVRVNSTRPSDPVDVARLKSAWMKVVKRHAALRTLVVEEAGYLQVVLSDYEPTIIEIPMGVEFDDYPLELQSSKPPHRFSISTQKDGSAIVKLEVHHSMVDGESLLRVLGDIVKAYVGLLPEEPPPAFSNYIGYVLSQSTGISLDYWATYLQHFTPTYMPLVTENASKSQWRRFQLDVDLDSSVIRRLSGSYGVTFSNMVQVAWALVLKHYTASDDVCFGYMSSGRDAPVDGCEDMIGAFMSILICRLQLDNNKVLKDVLGEAKEHYANSLDHQHCSLAEIQHALKSVLGLTEIGINDSFFKLGGDSILGMRLVAAANAVDIPLSVSLIFHKPILAELALELEGKASSVMLTQVVEPFALVSAGNELCKLLAEVAGLCEIDTTEIVDLLPCTPLQEGLMAISAHQEGAYAARLTFSVPEGLPSDDLKQAWQTTVDSMQMLRTRIVHTSEGSLQAVVAPKPIVWHHAESLDAYAHEDKLNKMSHGSQLTRSGLVTTLSGDRFFVMSAHHAIYDGYSINLIFDTLRKALLHEEISPGPAFATFLSHLEFQDAKVAADYWRSQLDGARPSAFPALPSKSYQAKVNNVQHRSIHVSRSGSDILTSNIMRAAWAQLMAKYNNADDIVIGVTLSGRNAPVPGILDLAAPTVTTVPVRITVGDKAQTIEEFLHEVQKQAVEMIPHEHTGLQNIRTYIASEDAKEALEFKNLFLVQPSTQTSRSISIAGMEMIGAPLEGFDSFAIVVECTLNDGSVEVELRHDESIISAEQTLSLLTQYEHLVHQFCSDDIGSKTVGDVSFASRENIEMLRTWNNDRTTMVNACIHEVLSQKASECPDKEAVLAHDGSFTYSQLDKLSDRLAFYLVEKYNLQPEQILPTCFEKSIWTTVVMLAIFKAGASNTALNPQYPRKRMEEITATVDAHLIICSPSQLEKVDGLASDTLVIDPDLFEDLSEFSRGPEVSIKPTNSAFIAFTSGSTGQPKAIVIQHDTFLTNILAQGPAVGHDEFSRVLQFAAHTFDVCNGEIFTTLLCGGTVCIPSDSERLDDLAGAMERMRVNMAYLTPSVASMLKPEDVPSLKTLILGGERLHRQLVETWSSKLNLCAIYGATECSIWSTSLSNISEDSDGANVGRAYAANTWVVDPEDHEKLVGIGMVGELVMQGAIISREYLHDRLGTAASFIRPPTWLPEDVPNRRLYKTGDLVRQLPDGSLDFIGRKDTQIKLHGNRIELGEIDHHIVAQMPSIRQVAVELIEHDGSRLAAFINLDEILDNEPESHIAVMSPDLLARFTKLQKALQSVMPSYMVPIMYIPITRMPKTVTGKLDRAQL
ncbi:acetyl-CoA synthetase-like protein, partial [Myriangium duriaei CBS 260.36]